MTRGVRKEWHWADEMWKGADSVVKIEFPPGETRYRDEGFTHGVPSFRQSGTEVDDGRVSVPVKRRRNSLLSDCQKCTPRVLTGLSVF